jgi:NodT family efflux transporter outer membrane factor (OMF) lipoprotein
MFKFSSRFRNPLFRHPGPSRHPSFRWDDGKGIGAAMALAPLLLLTACTVGPDYKGPPKVASSSAFVRAADPALTAAPGLARWWEGLNDAVLTALVDDALAHSPNIAAAEAKIRAAQAKLAKQKTSELPTVSANAAAVHAALPGIDLGSGSGSRSTLNFYNLGLTASWEPDLWGGGRRGIEAARATVGQRYADLADVQVSLTAQLAQAYVNLRDVQARARLNAESSRLQGEALALTRQRFAAGTASDLDVERLQTQRESTDAQAVPLQAQIAQYLDQLAVLTGRAPGALDATLQAPAAIPLPPASVAIGDPAALIARRPDVRAAERELAADTAQIGVDKAKLFPNLQFMGILGLGGTHPGDVFDLGNLTSLVAPMLNWSVLDFGKNRAQMRVSQATREAAEATYAGKVLAALQDAETSLSRFGNYRLQLAGYARAEQSAIRAAQLNDLRLKAGTSSTIDQLDIERQRLQAQIAVAQAKAQLTVAYVTVQKALGLGWSETGKR